MSGDALDGVDVHAEVGQPSDARATCCVDGDLLRASDVRQDEHVLDEPVDGRVPLEAYDVLHRLGFGLQLASFAKNEPEGESPSNTRIGKR